MRASYLRSCSECSSDILCPAFCLLFPQPEDRADSPAGARSFCIAVLSLSSTDFAPLDECSTGTQNERIEISILEVTWRSLGIIRRRLMTRWAATLAVCEMPQD